MAPVLKCNLCKCFLVICLSLPLGPLSNCFNWKMLCSKANVELDQRGPLFFHGVNNMK